MQNKSKYIRCPICGAHIDNAILNAPFATGPSQPGYAEETESGSDSCCDRVQGRIDITNGCVGHFVYGEWNFLKWFWCGQIQEGFQDCGAYAVCCTRIILAVPVTSVIVGCVTTSLSVSMCCCVDCCYICFPEQNWRLECMVCFSQSAVSAMNLLGLAGTGMTENNNF